MTETYKLNVHSKPTHYPHDTSEDYNYIYDKHSLTAQEIETLEEIKQKKLESRINNFQDPKTRKLTADNIKELNYLWTSDPDRHKEVYDSGEVKELNHIYEKIAVRRIFDDKNKFHKNPSGLVRVKTSKPVVWSNGRFIDIENTDKKELERLKTLLHEQDTSGGYGE